MQNMFLPVLDPVTMAILSFGIFTMGNEVIVPIVQTGLSTITLKTYDVSCVDYMHSMKSITKIHFNV